VEGGNVFSTPIPPRLTTTQAPFITLSTAVLFSHPTTTTLTTTTTTMRPPPIPPTSTTTTKDRGPPGSEETKDGGGKEEGPTDPDEGTAKGPPGAEEVPEEQPKPDAPEPIVLSPEKEYEKGPPGSQPESGNEEEVTEPETKKPKPEPRPPIPEKEKLPPPPLKKPKQPKKPSGSESKPEDKGPPGSSESEQPSPETDSGDKGPPGSKRVSSSKIVREKAIQSVSAIKVHKQPTLKKKSPGSESESEDKALPSSSESELPSSRIETTVKRLPGSKSVAGSKIVDDAPVQSVSAIEEKLMKEFGGKKSQKKKLAQGDHFKVYITDGDSDNDVDNLSLHSDGTFEKIFEEKNNERIAEEENLFQSQQQKKKENSDYRNLEKEQHHSDYRKFYGSYTPQETKNMHQRFQASNNNHEANPQDKIHHGVDFDKPKRDVQKGSREEQSRDSTVVEEEEESKILEEEKVYRMMHANEKNKKEKSESNTIHTRENSREEKQIYAATHGSGGKNKSDDRESVNSADNKPVKDNETGPNKKSVSKSLGDDVFSVPDEVPTESSLDSYEKNLLRKSHNSGKNTTGPGKGDAASKDDIIELLKQYGKLKDEVTELTQENEETRVPVYDFNGEKKSEQAKKRQLRRHRDDYARMNQTMRIG